MNADTIVSYQGGTGRNQIGSQTLASTTETEFKVNQDAGANNAIAVLTMPQGTEIFGSASPQDPNANAAVLMSGNGRQWGRVPGTNAPYFNSASFDNGRPFIVRVCGLATPASNAGNTLTVKLYLGTSKSGTNIATTGAVPQATTTTAKSFIMEAQCIWDSTSQAVTGQFWFQLAGTSGTTYSTWAALSNAGSSITLANLKFVASAQWGNAAGGVVAVSEFSILNG